MNCMGPDNGDTDDNDDENHGRDDKHDVVDPRSISKYVSPNKGRRTGVGFLLAFYRITLAFQDCSSPGYLSQGI